MKKLLILILVFSLLLVTPIQASAKTLSSQDLSAFIPSVGIESYQLIKSGYCSIHDNYDGSITIEGYTKTYYAVDRIGIIFNLQYFNGSDWVTLRNYPFEALNSYDITKYLAVTVSPGFSYRVLTEHYAIDNGLTETGTSVSGSITVQ